MGLVQLSEVEEICFERQTESTDSFCTSDEDEVNSSEEAVNTIHSEPTTSDLCLDMLL